MPAARDIAAAHADQEGWAVTEAENGRVALERMAEQPTG